VQNRELHPRGTGGSPMSSIENAGGPPVPRRSKTPSKRRRIGKDGTTAKGREFANSLREMIDTIKTGVRLSKRYTVRHVEAPMPPARKQSP
jgi:hypothetical protein